MPIAARRSAETPNVVSNDMLKSARAVDRDRISSIDRMRATGRPPVLRKNYIRPKKGASRVGTRSHRIVSCDCQTPRRTTWSGAYGHTVELTHLSLDCTAP